MKRGDFMSRVLALSRVSEYKVRFLCLSNTLDVNKARVLMSKIPYPCYDINMVLSSLSGFQHDLYYVDYTLKKPLECIPIVNSTVQLKTVKVKDTFQKFLNKYNPFLIPSSIIRLSDSLIYCKESGWISCNGVLLCNWKPYYKDNDMISHFDLIDGILSYKLIKPMYILTQGNARHRPAEIGEAMFINLASFDCSRSIHKLSNTYSEAVYCFDRVLREWIKISESVPEPVLGRKSG